MRRAAKVGLAGLLLTICVSGGCASSERAEAYQGVAKEWSKAIRASQVIPVYPLTEDIQPGDMFIVDVPIETEQELWDEKGYLPLGYHFGRLNIGPDEYKKFYGREYGNGVPGKDGPPLLYQEQPAASRGAVKVVSDRKNGRLEVNAADPAAQPAPAPTAPPGAANARAKDEIPLELRRELQNWGLAPHVSFPSYSVDVSRSGGFNIGLPVQGIPIALGLLGSNRATASVSLKEAYSYGLDAQRFSRSCRTTIRI
jgi:hypothetical protein